jgi:hypothetical protein
MTFQPEGGDVPLFWGQLLTQANKPGTVAPNRKKTKSKRIGLPGNLQQRVALALLVPLNIGLISFNWVHTSQASQVAQTRQVQALVAPTPVVDAVQIQPVHEPTAVSASVVSEKVEPTPTPTPTVKAASTARLAPMVSDWDGLLQKYFGNNWVAAKKVMMCESGGNAHAINAHSGATGLMQIMPLPGRPSQSALLDPETNLAAAAKISGNGSSWKAWTCKP